MSFIDVLRFVLAYQKPPDLNFNTMPLLFPLAAAAGSGGCGGAAEGAGAGADVDGRYDA